MPLNDGMPHLLREATRLTRAGRLAEATALLQGRLRGEGPGPDPAGGSVIIDVEAVEVAPATPAAGGGGPPRSGLREALRGLAAGLVPDGGLPGNLGQPAPASVPVPEGASFATATFANEAGSRAYKLYVPAGHRGRRLPLVVMLHGCTQSPDDFAAGTRMNELAEAEGFLVAYPAQPASANASKCWNWFQPADQQRGRGEPSLIAGLTRRILRDHPVDPARIYIAGLSAGGAAAAVLAAAYPELYAAVGVHSGLACGAASDLPSALAAMRQGATPAELRRPARPVPTIVFHGDRDATVHPRNGDQVIAQARAASAGLRTAVRRGQVPGGHAFSRTLHADPGGRVLLEHWTIHGAGHAWAGGSPTGSHTDPKGPDASREMLRFFLEHPHPAAGPLG